MLILISNQGMFSFMNTESILYLTRLSMMGDWLRMADFNAFDLVNELDQFKDSWRKYNPHRPNNRFGLSVTSLDGGLSGVPDLDSLARYNSLNGTNLKNADFNKPTDVYHKCPTLQKILKPYLPWLGRCHFIKLNEGGFFPEHYDHNKIDLDAEDLRLIGFVSNNDICTYKFCYENKLITHIKDGHLYYFNAHKSHSVFSMNDHCIQLVICLRFDQSLFQTLLQQYSIQ
jgi:hypothetical protein